ncbi:MAG: SDR family NAD(P)-dependent oxidoreductase [Calditrichaceae bacterium]|nr:SDR family NAD(P)-dependent oxidoreductase [Calditrichaceae bacterium]HES59655.1 SDR family NAD(P)-dependent oxidoreductase [Caldithrix sp.]
MKKVIILGATSGIGRELAVQMVHRGYKVGGCGRTEKILQKMENELAPNFIGHTLDLRETAKLDINLNQLIEQLGSMDICIISSGISEPNPLLEWELEENVFKTNILGFAAAAGFVVRYFLNQRHGHLVGITSLTKYFPNKTSPAYNASKVFESNYLNSMRYRMQGKDLFVTEICPGFIDTPIVRKRRITLMAPVDRAAKQIIKAIEKKRKTVIVTKRWKLIRWLIPLTPDWIFRRLT